MSFDGEAFFSDMVDRRNIKALAEQRHMLVSMITKSYNHKDLEKLNEFRNAKFKREAEMEAAAQEKKEKMEEDEKWKLDKASRLKRNRGWVKNKKLAHKQEMQKEMDKLKEQDREIFRKKPKRKPY